MCTNHDSSDRAVSLEHGEAHDHDHNSWSRRDFLVRSGLGTAAALALGSSRVHALTGNGLLARLGSIETDRVLVLLQLKGGNDGLNTIVPVGNDLYHAARPGLALNANQTVNLADGFAMHDGLAPLQSLWGDGKVAVVHSVGYDAPNLSHFASTDIWTTGRTTGQSTPEGGVGGRAMRSYFPDYEAGLPVAPPALQLAAQNPLLFQSGDSDLSMMVSSIEALQQIEAGGGLYNSDDVPDSPFGSELGYVRSVANAANTYIGAVRNASNAGVNAVAYPNTGLGKDLAGIARLIKGQLGSKMYVVSLGGFDTHYDQLNRHGALMAELGGAVAAFYADLADGGHDQRTLTMTFSEFGRRMAQNGSGGTDHGAAAPLFAFGPGVAGGLYGTAPNLSNLDGTGNVRASTDFRQTYAAVLGSWLGLPAADLATILGGDYPAVPLVGSPVGTGGGPSEPALTLRNPAPNPASGTTRIVYSLASAGRARICVYDALGRRVAVPADGWHAAGPHSAEVDASRLPAGTYVVRLETPQAAETTRLTVVR